MTAEATLRPETLPSRVESTQATLGRMLPYLRTCGITRVANLTRLDRIGIPVVNVIAPRSNDEISVYNGKGITLEAATVSAVMEAVERFAAALPKTPVRIESVTSVERSGTPFVDPAEVCLQAAPRFHRDLPISWHHGRDLMSGELVLVPVSVAGYHTHPHEYPTHRISTTNGLASGNTFAEATFHALAEVIERDAWMIADVTARAAARAARALELGPDAFSSVEYRYPRIPALGLPAVLAELVDRFTAADVEIVLRDLSDGADVVTILALAVDDGTSGISAGHFGLGTHTNALVACARALTEVAQGRAVDISAAREDITTAETATDPWLRHVQRASHVNRDVWPLNDDGNSRPFEDLPRAGADDLDEDLQTLLAWSRDHGLPRAVVVDLSPPTVPVSVVRVVVPEAESWVVDHSRAGRRAAAAWREALATCTDRATESGAAV